MHKHNSTENIINDNKHIVYLGKEDTQLFIKALSRPPQKLNNVLREANQQHKKIIIQHEGHY